MANVSSQYRKEMEQRYLKYVQQEDDRNVRKPKKRVIKKEGCVATLDRYIPSTYRVSTIILDSQFRDIYSYPDANNFVSKLMEPLRDVAALRLMRTEFYQPSNTMGYFVMNEVRVPLQLYNIESAYLYLNAYQSMLVANETNTTFFGRIGPGTEIYPAVTGDIRQDPLMFTLLPSEPRLKRFHVKLLQADGSVYPVTNARVVITLAAYCMAPGTCT